MPCCGRSRTEGMKIVAFDAESAKQLKKAHNATLLSSNMTYLPGSKVPFHLQYPLVSDRQHQVQQVAQSLVKKGQNVVLEKELTATNDSTCFNWEADDELCKESCTAEHPPSGCWRHCDYKKSQIKQTYPYRWWSLSSAKRCSKCAVEEPAAACFQKCDMKGLTDPENWTLKKGAHVTLETCRAYCAVEQPYDGCFKLCELKGVTEPENWTAKSNVVQDQDVNNSECKRKCAVQTPPTSCFEDCALQGQTNPASWSKRS
eukprot:NODE_5267_length_963_cov_121.307143_g5052_i0.p1 GENE.NODE_5267_length_963_cov_121.307143_g5052_i0~~NODE_5267_length_963_cov_121.307143_g5052_i0.p1  ORF type:complete len:283 (-),score=47.95 NODE_5267_length_963_cov_121.307143_g5052_i0:114-890(-)